MGTVLMIHGEIRWLVAIAAVIVIIKFLIGWLGKKEYTSVDKTLLMVYTILLDINVLLGLIILFFFGGFSGPRLEHATTMILAAIAAHMTSIWRKSTDSTIKYRNQFLLVLLSLALILMGVIRLRGGFVF